MYEGLKLLVYQASKLLVYQALKLPVYGALSSWCTQELRGNIRTFVRMRPAKADGSEVLSLLALLVQKYIY